MAIFVAPGEAAPNRKLTALSVMYAILGVAGVVSFVLWAYDFNGLSEDEEIKRSLNSADEQSKRNLDWHRKRN